MGIPAPTTKKRDERLSPEELSAFLKKHGLGELEFAHILGVSTQAVKLWTSGQREFSLTNSRLVRLFMKHPVLLKEF